MPEASVTSENAGNKVLINGRRPLHESKRRLPPLSSRNDFKLISQWSLGVRDKRRREESVCSSTNRTFDAADAKPYVLVFVFNAPGITAMNVEAGRMAAGTGKPVERNVGQQVIVKNLRNRIVKISK
mgnify:CR=1 FL=1